MYDPGHPIHFEIGGPYISPDGAAINFNLGVVEVFVQAQGVGRNIGWKKARPVGASWMLPWGKRPGVDKRLVFSIKGSGRKDLASFSVIWSAPFNIRSTIKSPWGETNNVGGSEYSFPWESPPPRYNRCSSPWCDLDQLDTVYASAWINSCNPTDFTRAILYGSTEGQDTTISSPWINRIPVQDVYHRTYWGDELYARLCYRTYEPLPGNALHFNLETDISHVFDSDNLRFYFEPLSYDERCKQREPSGWRDNHIRVPYPDYVQVPIQRVYSYMSSMSLVRSSDGMDLPLSDASVKTNFDSWCFDFTATLKSEAAYLAVMPTPAGNTGVQFTLNGYVFLLDVEDAGEVIRFGRRFWKVSGRSISAELAEPTAPVSSYTETNQRTAVQLMEQAILNTGWSINFSGVDWLVDANALTYNDLTPIKVVKNIAEAGGYRVQTVRNNKTLNIIPRYKGHPWDWAAATPDISIPESVPKSFRHKWKGGPSYNGIYVSGTSQGVICFVKRTGTDGTPLAPMVTNPLMTATEAGRSLGSMHLAASGNYDIVSIDLPLAETPGEPGLLLPGTLVEISQSRGTWIGQVTSCKVAGKWNRGLVVRQYIEVERYYG